MGIGCSGMRLPGFNGTQRSRGKRLKGTLDTVPLMRWCDYWDILAHKDCRHWLPNWGPRHYNVHTINGLSDICKQEQTDLDPMDQVTTGNQNSTSTQTPKAQESRIAGFWGKVAQCGQAPYKVVMGILLPAFPAVLQGELRLLYGMQEGKQATLPGTSRCHF